MATASVISQMSSTEGARKAAVLLVALGPEAASELLKNLESHELELVAASMSALGPISAEECDTVLEEFLRQLDAPSVLAYGGLRYTRSVVARAFGEEFATQLERRLPTPATLEQEVKTSLRLLTAANPEDLANLLEKENPQATAVIAATLGPNKAARMIESLPQQRQQEVILRMAGLTETSPEVLQTIADGLAAKLRFTAGTQKNPTDGRKSVAEVLNQLNPDLSGRLLQTIEQHDSRTADSIKRMLFLFEDILKFDQKSMRELVGRIDRKLLVLGLKGVSEELRNHFLSVMSKNGASMLLEDMEALGPVKIREVEAAQQDIIGLIRQMESEGLLDLKSSGAEQYVV